MTVIFTEFHGNVLHKLIILPRHQRVPSFSDTHELNSLEKKNWQSANRVGKAEEFRGGGLQNYVKIFCCVVFSNTHKVLFKQCSHTWNPMKSRVVDPFPPVFQLHPSQAHGWVFWRDGGRWEAIITIITTTLKGAIRDLYNLLTALWTVSNTLAQVARAQSCANHEQHIQHLSRATCRVPHDAQGQLSY